MSIVFDNIGELDINAIRMMGVSVKSDNAIGFFGTGLKYAIAVLLRHSQRITIYSGLTKLVFGTERIFVRDSPFDAVTMNGQQLGFTTDLGKKWELWMAFRELHCNCKDEDGTTFEGAASPSKGHTAIAVEGDLFRAEFFKRHENFIEGAPLFTDGVVEIYDKPSSFVFYRGVRVAENQHRGLYTYNVLTRLDLTEDRTLLYSWSPNRFIGEAVMRLKDRSALYRIITAEQDTMEHNALVYGVSNYSEEFEEIAVREYKSSSLRVNDGIRKFVKRLNRPNLHEASEPSLLQRKQLDRATEFCKFIGYDCSEYETVIVETLGPSVMAEALRDHRRILLSKQCFDKGTKFLASTLIEEIIHLREGLADETRGLQTYLFDKIISLGEELKGEPL